MRCHALFLCFLQCVNFLFAKKEMQQSNPRGLLCFCRITGHRTYKHTDLNKKTWQADTEPPHNLYSQQWPTDNGGLL